MTGGSRNRSGIADADRSDPATSAARTEQLVRSCDHEIGSITLTVQYRSKVQACLPIMVIMSYDMDRPSMLLFGPLPGSLTP